MRFTNILLISLILIVSCQSQTENKNKFNLDFETYDSLYNFPKGWIEWGDYSLGIDTLKFHSGKYSGKIESKKNGSFGSIAYKIPANYEGKSIKLEGYMKIENIENGFGGLLLRIDGNQISQAFDNMENQNINGTIDWHKYSITLPYPKDASTIYVGGILTGSGKAWFDDFIITIDGKSIQNLTEKEKPTYKSNLDKEFDFGTKITFSKLDEKLIENLDLLGKVWGFLKYYHPEIGKGNYNWDYELFRLLPNYLKIKNSFERDQTLLKWIEKYGYINTCSTCRDASLEAFMTPDMSWLNEFSLSKELKNKLKYIYKNRFQGTHYYIGKNSVGGPKFKNERKYYTMPFNDDGFKLLALYRYWNVINYFFPYKYLTEKKWSKVLKEYIPKFINSNNKLEYEMTCINLISEINDTHATTRVGFNNVQSSRGSYYPPFKVQFIEEKLVVTDYYNPELKDVSEFEVGDIITGINGKSLDFLIDSINSFYPASNNTVKMRDISRDLLRSNKKSIRVDYISNNEKKQSNLLLYEENDLNIRWYKWTGEKCYKFLEDNIGYVNLEFIKIEDVPHIKEIFKNTKGIIIDLRSYPSSFVPFSLGSYFVSSQTAFVKFTNFNINNSGEFVFKEGEPIPKPTETYKGKLIVLVNEFTQSQAEYTAMAFRAGNNTKIIGSTTAGTDGNVSSLYLPGGLLTAFSGIGIYYPDGTETQRIGIVPDIEIKPTIKGIKKGRDELLEKAVDIINEL